MMVAWDADLLMSTVLIGSQGQLAGDLAPLLEDGTVGWGHGDLDITDAAAVTEKIKALQPELVINTAAYNLVNQAEREPEVAYRVNALGARNLALACSEIDATLLHVSSDYVFGLDAERGEPYVENDEPGPQGAYAQSKLAGEYYVRSLCPKHFVVRTCGLYGRAATRVKGNFVETMLRLGAERDRLTVVDDQRCTPSWTRDVARAIAALSQTEAYGVYHATNAGSMTWCEFAREIFQQAGLPVDVQPITTAEFGAAAPRPGYSVLSCEKLKAAIGLELPAWQEALAEYLRLRTEQV